jgi:hypothetical protein
MAEIFIIDYEVVDDNYNTINTFKGIYNDLEIAKNELKKIYNNTPDYKFFCYKIKIFHLIDNEYKFTNKFYTYSFDKFTMFDYMD